VAQQREAAQDGIVRAIYELYDQGTFTKLLSGLHFDVIPIWWRDIAAPYPQAAKGSYRLSSEEHSEEHSKRRCNLGRENFVSRLTALLQVTVWIGC
jgi:hypothetical protein